MTDSARTKIQQYKSRHTIYLPSEFVKDSAFPFKIGEELIARIHDDHIMIERALKGATSKGKS